MICRDVLHLESYRHCAWTDSNFTFRVSNVSLLIYLSLCVPFVMFHIHLNTVIWKHTARGISSHSPYSVIRLREGNHASSHTGGVAITPPIRSLQNFGNTPETKGKDLRRTWVNLTLNPSSYSCLHKDRCFDIAWLSCNKPKDEWPFIRVVRNDMYI